MSVEQLFRKRYALEFKKLRVFIGPSVQRKTHLPWTSEYLGVVNRCFVLQDVSTHGCISFDHMHRIAMEVSGTVEPGLVIETGDIHHQSVSIPVAERPSHVAVDRCGVRFVEID